MAPCSVRKMWTLWAGDVLIGAYDTRAQLEAWLEFSTSLYEAGESTLRVDPRTLTVAGPVR